MKRSGGDEPPGAAHTPGGEPAPAELWITGGGGPVDRGGPDPGGHGGPGGTGRTRWIALAAGFAVLVAVIAVQHFAGGSPAASSSAPTTSATTAPSATPSATSGASDQSTAPSTTPSTPPSSEQPTTSASASRIGDSTAASVQDPLGDGGRPTTTSIDTTSPSTTRVATHLLPGAGDWELVGYGTTGLVRYRPSSGTVTVTPVPSVLGNNVVSFVVTGSAAVIRPMNNVSGYLVTDGKPATPLTGLLQHGARVLPGPDPGRLWVVTQTLPDGTLATSGGLVIVNGQRPQLSLVLVDVHGVPAGPTIDLPDSLYAGGFGFTPDGSGGALVRSIGGIYDATPAGLRLVTHGRVLAAGPTGFLVYECDDTARCSLALVDRTHLQHRSLRKPSPTLLSGIGGAISPDGTQAALLQFGPSSPVVHLIDLRTGKSRDINVTIGGPLGSDGSSLLAFTPDGRYLLIAGMSGVVPIDLHTGKQLDPLPFPPIQAIAIRPGD